jgi:hypothetical protein
MSLPIVFCIVCIDNIRAIQKSWQRASVRPKELNEALREVHRNALNELRHVTRLPHQRLVDRLAMTAIGEAANRAARLSVRCRHRRLSDRS